MKNYYEFPSIFLFNQVVPKSDNRSCRLGLRLDLVSKQETELISIGRNSTMLVKYVNGLDITNLRNMPDN